MIAMGKNEIVRCPELHFKKITSQNIEEVWRFCRMEPGRTCDFSYGGILMWADIFDYEYAIFDETLFIKGKSEDDMEAPAFSLPVGKMALSESLKLLNEWCKSQDLSLVLSAVPEYALEEILSLEPSSVSELEGWGDYLYEINSLATLSGKKMAKKRNHVNQFLHNYGNDCYERITKDNLADVEEFMSRLESTPAPSASAAIERSLAMEVLKGWERNEGNFLGGLLRINGRVEAFTIGDIKGDTLFIHIEKGNREIAGSYEMINKAFAEDMLNEFPHLKFINREDDSGDEGLRQAKMSYHPIELLKKFSVKF